MSSHTPLFDAALDAYYQDKKPGTFTCEETGEEFEITKEEFALYRSLGMPLPTVAPWVRHRRQRAFVAGFYLYRRTQPDGSFLITMYDPECPVPILAPPVWYSDAFDPLTYGRPLDPNRSFFDQWLAFSPYVPRPAIMNDPKSENSSWSVYSYNVKNCYFTYGGGGGENLTFCERFGDYKNSVDSAGGSLSEWCYETVICNHCARAFFSERCESCLDIYFCLNCISCQDCFGCTNLEHKQFCFFNEQLTESEYRKRLKEIDLKDYKVLEQYKQKASEIWNKAWRVAGRNSRIEESIGDELMDCRDVVGVDMAQVERAYNCFAITGAKDVIDSSSSERPLERTANTIYALGYDLKMVSACINGLDLEYCELMFSSEHCFGCIGLTHKRFCIFNKQYTEEEYWPLVDAIKTAMLARGEYGEFFPYRASLFAYNASHADALHPLSKEEATTLGSRWYSFQHELTAPASPIEELPLCLDETFDDVLSKSFRCPVSGHAFRYVKPELDFHRQFGIALPRVAPAVRRTDRANRQLPMHLYKRTCGKCQKQIFARIPPSSPLPLLCESCYETWVIKQDHLKPLTA
jgi:hypothetical protein